MIIAHRLASGLDPFGQNLTQLAWIKLDLHGFTQYDLGHVWKNADESESGKWAAACLHSARTKPNESCTPACFQTRCFWPKPDQAIHIGSSLVLHSMTGAFFGRMELNWMREVGYGIYMIWHNSGCTLAVMAITGHKQNAFFESDPACSLG